MWPFIADGQLGASDTKYRPGRSSSRDAEARQLARCEAYTDRNAAHKDHRDSEAARPLACRCCTGLVCTATRENS